MWTAVDSLLQRPCFAVNVQAVPNEIVRHELAEVQEQVLRAMDLDLFRTTLGSLHLSVFPLIWARGKYTREPEKLWNAISQEWLRGVVEACDRTSRFELRFSKLVATESAVILLADEPADLTAVRTELEVWGHSLRIPVYRPRSAHITLFRYREVASLGDVRQSLQHLDVAPVDWSVQGLSVREETVYPSLACTELLAIGLRNRDER